LINTIAEAMSQYNNPLRLEGHTDNIPISSAQFPSNWELSTAVGWLPSSGMLTVGLPFSLRDRLLHLLMPSIVLATFPLAQLTRYVRSSMVEALAQVGAGKVALISVIAQESGHRRDVLRSGAHFAGARGQSSFDHSPAATADGGGRSQSHV
jgi:hypothetical protein